MSQWGVDRLKEFSERHETELEPFETWRLRVIGGNVPPPQSQRSAALAGATPEDTKEK